MSKLYGSQSMVTSLQSVLVRRPDPAFGNADPSLWHYSAKIDLTRAQAEHDAFVGLLQQHRIEVIYHDVSLPEHADAIYVHDPVLVTDAGAILLKMGKSLRRGEETAIGNTLAKLGIPIICQLQGDALAEGGDLLWVDEKTLAVGLGFRTNREGLRQIRDAVDRLGVEIISVDLPFFQGPEACLHLMSFISIVSHDIAVVYEPLIPVPFWQFLKDRGFRFVNVPDQEFWTMAPNVLALAPGICIMLENNPVTKRRLEEAGCQVSTYAGGEISLKAEGGATCLTRPILRA